MDGTITVVHDLIRVDRESTQRLFCREVPGVRARGHESIGQAGLPPRLLAWRFSIFACVSTIAVHIDPAVPGHRQIDLEPDLGRYDAIQSAMLRATARRGYHLR